MSGSAGSSAHVGLTVYRQEVIDGSHNLIVYLSTLLSEPQILQVGSAACGPASGFY